MDGCTYYTESKEEVQLEFGRPSKVACASPQPPMVGLQLPMA